MAKLTETLEAAWNERKGPAILATVNQAGSPNLAYISSIVKTGDTQFVIVDNYFNKTRENILAGSQGALLFRTKAGKPYQVKGKMEYHTNGEIYEEMLSWIGADNPEDSELPGNAAIVLNVEAIYES
jgi:predicted pyridoxine 5'-phosphate oxidase superfamily flavin-nucleotide-binding protein